MKPFFNLLRIGALIALIIIFFKNLHFLTGDKIENQVAEDAVKQYNIAKRQGDKMQTYVQCSLVATAYLQAKDETNYNIWKNREDSLAKKLHLSVLR